MKIVRGTVLGVLVAASMPLRADFTYTETIQVTGGSMLGLMKMAGAFSRQARQAGDPVVSTVAVKGNRMAHIGPDRTEIIDLDAETITTIDTLKRQYSVMTFEQMKRQIEAAAAKMKEQQQKSQPASPQQPSTTDVTFKVHVRNTGQGKDVAGLDTKEAIMTMSMDATDKSSGQTGSLAITNDMWLTPSIPGYEEVAEFYRKFALKMGTVFSSAINPAMLAQYQGAGKGMAQMTEEMAKLKGTPILQVMRMGMTADGQPLPAASEAPLPPPPAGPTMPSAGEVAQQSASSAIASKLGGFGLGGFGHKKKADPPPADTATDSGSSTGAAQPASSVLVETSTQMGAFSRTVNEANFAIPVGFKLVQMKGEN
jgi:RPA family protein